MGKKEWKAMKKKRTFSNVITGFFNDDSKFMTFIGRVALLASANVCWLVCSLPAVTGGAALIALYTVLLERKEQTYDTAFKRFFQVFAKTLLPSLPLWLLTLGVGTALATAWRIVLRENLTDHFAGQCGDGYRTAVALSSAGFRRNLLAGGASGGVSLGAAGTGTLPAAVAAGGSWRFAGGVLFYGVPDIDGNMAAFRIRGHCVGKATNYGGSP